MIKTSSGRRGRPKKIRMCPIVDSKKSKIIVSLVLNPFRLRKQEAMVHKMIVNRVDYQQINLLSLMPIKS